MGINRVLLPCSGPEGGRAVVPGGSRCECLHLRHVRHRGQWHQRCPLRHHERELPQPGGGPGGWPPLSHRRGWLPAQEKLGWVQSHLTLPGLRGESGQKKEEEESGIRKESEKKRAV